MLSAHDSLGGWVVVQVYFRDQQSELVDQLNSLLTLMLQVKLHKTTAVTAKKQNKNCTKVQFWGICTVVFPFYVTFTQLYVSDSYLVI